VIEPKIDPHTLETFRPTLAMIAQHLAEAARRERPMTITLPKLRCLAEDGTVSRV
jgi:hypothetical protein